MPAAPSRTPAYAALAAHFDTIGPQHLRDLFADDPRRVERCVLTVDGLRYDYSRQRVTPETVKRLAALARERGVDDFRRRLFAGEPLNSTEGRAVLHMALRDPDGSLTPPERAAEARAERARMRALVERIHGGAWRGFTGQRITDVVNLGIGGSDLGPAMVVQALTPDHRPGLRAHFVSNVDGAQLHQTLAHLRPDSTLFIVASKSFSTEETLQNARSARAWLVKAMGDEAAVARHFVALSTHVEAVKAFGIDPDNILRFWDWVGGRFSLWSAIGLSIALATSMETFDALCAGAHAMDRHALEAPFEANIPALMALIGWWYTEFFGFGAHGVLPYDQNLARLPAYLQQAEMESNGKRVRRDGSAVDGMTCPIVFGEPGTNGQHAFYQLLHQGTHIVPVDLLVAAEARHPLDAHHRLLLANCFAQAEALAMGRSADEVRAQMAATGMAADEIERLVPHRTFPGNRPSATLMYARLDAFTLGRIIAAYEHKIAFQGALWGVNSFDQWGVELGKVLARGIAPDLAPGAGAIGARDPATAAAIAAARALGAR